MWLYVGHMVLYVGHMVLCVGRMVRSQCLCVEA
jgi:hypothetical protein